MNKLPLLFILLVVMSGCTKAQEQKKQRENTENTTHTYGGWYCPDNLNGFPPVNIADWKSVPVIEGRLPTEEETKTEASLFYIDAKKYPNAKVIDIQLPQLATYYTDQTKKKETVIIIQAISIGKDSIVGFRYLNGGNGSARYNEIKFLSDKEVYSIPTSKFVTQDLNINTTENKVWEVLTKSENLEKLKYTFIKNTPTDEWRSRSNINYHYAPGATKTSAFADKLYGCFYIQNDYLINGDSYTEKILLLKNEKEGNTELKMVFGPFGSDFETQQTIINAWGQKIKELSEQH